MSFLSIEKLCFGIQKLGLDLSDCQVKQLDLFSSMLFKWNKTYNLTSINGRDDILTHHILDSLAAAAELKKYVSNNSISLLDVGAGGGLPAIPLAITFPEYDINMVDTVGKKVAFLTQVILTLKLKNAQAFHSRVETLNHTPYDVISSRAFSSLGDFVGLTQHLLKNGGFWFALKANVSEAEIATLRKEYKISHLSKINVPFLNEERNIVLIQRIA